MSFESFEEYLDDQRGTEGYEEAMGTSWQPEYESEMRSNFELESHFENMDSDSLERLRMNLREC